MKLKRWIAIGTIICGLVGCDDFLDVKPDQSVVVPETIQDVRALLDNTTVFNEQPAIPAMADDDFRISDAGYSSLSNNIEQGAYIWTDDPYLGGSVGDWNKMYSQVFYANIALETLDGFGAPEDEEVNVLRGTALFFRAYAYLQLLQVFAPPYRQEGVNSERLGIILRERADVNDVPERTDLETCYQKVLSDLELAVSLLPDQTVVSTRPTKPAAYGALARAHLVMFNFELSADAAEKALDSHGEGLDFNELDASSVQPFERFNRETVFYSNLMSYAFFRSPELYINPDLASQYDDNDLRKLLYFEVGEDSLLRLTKPLGATTQMFGGIAVGELELMAAEGYARSGKEQSALHYLNRFASNRYRTGTWIPHTDLEQADLLDIILLERRKELVGRGLRWMDLRRLNQESGKEKTILKPVNGSEYRLFPNSPRYTFPIPDNEVNLNHTVQNDR